MENPIRIGCIGEAMIELGEFDLAAGTARIGFAGDALNTAIYLARRLPAGFGVDFITNLGVDRISDRMLVALTAEGIGITGIGRVEDRLPGLYAIETDAQGERTFHYWREQSAARTLFSGPGTGLVDLARLKVIYLTGITLAILPVPVRQRLIATLKARRKAGAMVVFDPNYRARLWRDAVTARACFAAMAQATDLALPGFDDEQQLYPGTTPEQVLARFAAFGVKEIVLKNGAAGVMVWHGGQILHPALACAAAVVDSTGAGDAFNAGYLAARLQAAGPEAAALAGHSLACRVIGTHGAILPRD